MSGKETITTLGTSEKKATQVFREFNAAQITEAYTELIDDPFLTRLAMPPGERRWATIRKQVPRDVKKICSVINMPYERVLIRNNLDQFRILAENNQLEFQQLVTKMGDLLHTVSFDLQDIIRLAFTLPSYRRRRILGDDLRAVGLYRRVPYLLQEADTPEKRLDKVIDGLVFTHEDALVQVSGGLNSEQLTALKADDFDTYKALCAQAGRLFAQSSFYGVLIDHSNAGKFNALKSQPHKNNGVTLTDAGICPAASFVRKYFIGVGNALQQNKERVLEITS